MVVVLWWWSCGPLPNGLKYSKFECSSSWQEVINSYMTWVRMFGCYAEPRVGESIAVNKVRDKLVKVDQKNM